MSKMIEIIEKTIDNFDNIPYEEILLEISLYLRSIRTNVVDENTLQEQVDLALRLMVKIVTQLPYSKIYQGHGEIKPWRLDVVGTILSNAAHEFSVCHEPNCESKWCKTTTKVSICLDYLFFMHHVKLDVLFPSPTTVFESIPPCTYVESPFCTWIIKEFGYASHKDFPDVNRKRSMMKDETCAICFNKMSPDKNFFLLSKCDHAFCIDCGPRLAMLKTPGSKTVSCAYCRTESDKWTIYRDWCHINYSNNIKHKALCQLGIPLLDRDCNLTDECSYKCKSNVLTNLDSFLQEKSGSFSFVWRILTEITETSDVWRKSEVYQNVLKKCISVVVQERGTEGEKSVHEWFEKASKAHKLQGYETCSNPSWAKSLDFRVTVTRKRRLKEVENGTETVWVLYCVAVFRFAFKTHTLVYSLSQDITSSELFGDFENYAQICKEIESKQSRS